MVAVVNLFSPFDGTSLSLRVTYLLQLSSFVAALYCFLHWRRAHTVRALIWTMATVVLFTATAVVGATLSGRGTAERVTAQRVERLTNFIGVPFARFGQVTVIVPDDSALSPVNHRCGVLLGVAARQNLVLLPEPSGEQRVWRLSSEVVTLTSGCGPPG